MDAPGPGHQAQAHGRKSREWGGGQEGQVPPNFETEGATPPPPQPWAKRGSFYLLHSGIFAPLAAINVKISARLRRAVQTFTTALAIKLNSL